MGAATASSTARNDDDDDDAIDLGKGQKYSNSPTSGSSSSSTAGSSGGGAGSPFGGMPGGMGGMADLLKGMGGMGGGGGAGGGSNPLADLMGGIGGGGAPGGGGMDMQALLGKVGCGDIFFFYISASSGFDLDVFVFAFGGVSNRALRYAPQPLSLSLTSVGCVRILHFSHVMTTLFFKHPQVMSNPRAMAAFQKAQSNPKMMNIMQVSG